MKKILLGIISLIALASCGGSLEDKANALIRKDMEKNLYHVETYDPAETLVDSAFTPFDDPVFYDKTLELYNLNMAINQYDEEMKRKKSSMLIYGSYQDFALNRNIYQEAKADYEKNAENKRKKESKARKLAKELKAMLESEQQFIGFRAQHSFRAENNAGQTVFGHREYLFDKDMSEIIAAYDMDSDEYKTVVSIFDQMLEEDVTIEDDTLSEE